MRREINLISKDIQDTKKLIEQLRLFGYNPKQVSDIINQSPRAKLYRQSETKNHSRRAEK